MEEVQGNARFPLSVSPIEVPKIWGQEKIIVNNELYCGKLLTIKKDGHLSLQYHLKKDETLYVVHGTVGFTWINTETATSETVFLEPGACRRLFPGTIHQFFNVGDKPVVLLEISTFHEDNDTYRISRSRHE